MNRILYCMLILLTTLSVPAFGQTSVAEQVVDPDTIMLHSQELQTVEVVGRIDRDYQSDYSFSATRSAIRNLELPQSLSSITKELIVDRQAFQLADAVKIVSGVAPSSFYNQYNIRGDHQFSPNDFVWGRYTWSQQDQTGPLGVQGTTLTTSIPAKNLGANYTHVQGAKGVFNVLFGYSSLPTVFR